MRQMILVQPVWHRVWQWPAVVNMITGGGAAGLYLMPLMAGAAGDVGPETPPALLKWAGPSLVLIGFLAIALEAGRPLSARHLLRHLRSSWMSREVLAGIVFVGFAVLDAVFPTVLFKAPAVLGASGLLLCQGVMVNRSKAVAAWSQKIIPLHFISSGMTLGFGLLLVSAPILNAVPSTRSIGLGMAFLLLNFVLWVQFVYLSREKSAEDASFALQRTESIAVSVGLGHAFPLLLLICLLILGPSSPASAISAILCLVSGAALLVGGVFQKGAILLQSNLFRAIRADFCSAR